MKHFGWYWFVYWIFLISFIIDIIFKRSVTRSVMEKWLGNSGTLENKGNTCNAFILWICKCCINGKWFARHFTQHIIQYQWKMWQSNGRFNSDAIAQASGKQSCIVSVFLINEDLYKEFKELFPPLASRFLNYTS